MHIPSSLPKPHAFFVFPETIEEMLAIIEAYSMKVARHPETDFELVLFFWTLRPEDIEGVMNSQDRRAAAGRLLAHYVDLLD